MSTHCGAHLFTEVMGITKFLHKLGCSSPAEADDWHGAVQYELCAVVCLFVSLVLAVLDSSFQSWESPKPEGPEG